MGGGNLSLWDVNASWARTVTAVVLVGLVIPGSVNFNSKEAMFADTVDSGRR